MANIDEIKQPKPFDQFTNISMALQISQKREKVDNAAFLELLKQTGGGGRRLEESIDFIEIVQKYLVIEGMYELKN